jgi:hypothetical protein
MEYTNSVENENNLILSDNNLKINNNEKVIIKKKKLIEISKNLSKIEYLEIFNIIQEDNCVYSENKNGIFINLSNVLESTIDRIFNFINFIQHKKEDLIKHDEYVHNAKKNITEKIVETSSSLSNNTNNIDYESDDSNINEETSNYLVFSSDEDEDLENKISLKKKKVKYTGKKAKMMKSIKDTTDKYKKS